jgi:penicillin-insensitive murein endopeptidase
MDLGGAAGILDSVTGAWVSRFCALVVTALCAACASGIPFDPAGSVSIGESNHGRLAQPKRLSAEGIGYTIPDTWRTRGNIYGTDELVNAVSRIGRQLHAREPGLVLGVADLSPQRGGRSSFHHSHQSGRDVDLLFLSRDEAGNALPPPQFEMIHYGSNGEAYHSRRRSPYVDPIWRKRIFDERRNWRVVEALLRDQHVRVQWIFVSRPLRAKILAAAKKENAPSWLIDYASTIMRQPMGAPPHDDHFHVRIYCPRADRRAGCEDSGPVWHHEKKRFKYGTTERYEPTVARAAASPAAWLPRF